MTWPQQRFLKTVSGIKFISEAVRHSLLENSTKNQITLNRRAFLVVMERYVTRECYNQLC
jgi:metal-responsive CopG/Arc/MetJ family transcriptional regulator